MCLGKSTKTSQSFPIGYGKNEASCYNISFSLIWEFSETSRIWNPKEQMKSVCKELPSLTISNILLITRVDVAHMVS